MSTSYFALRAPVASVFVTDAALWGKLYHLFRDDERSAGVLCPDALHLVADRDVKVARRDNSGHIVVTHPGPDDMQAISEYGELVTLGQLRRREAPELAERAAVVAYKRHRHAVGRAAERREEAISKAEAEYERECLRADDALCEALAAIIESEVRDA